MTENWRSENRRNKNQHTSGSTCNIFHDLDNILYTYKRKLSFYLPLVESGYNPYKLCGTVFEGRLK